MKQLRLQNLEDNSKIKKQLGGLNGDNENVQQLWNLDLDASNETLQQLWGPHIENERHKHLRDIQGDDAILKQLQGNNVIMKQLCGPLGNEEMKEQLQGPDDLQGDDSNSKQFQGNNVIVKQLLGPLEKLKIKEQLQGPHDNGIEKRFCTIAGRNYLPTIEHTPFFGSKQMQWMWAK